MLSKFEESLVNMRLSGMSHEAIARAIGKSHGRVRQFFMQIHRKLGIRLNCELNSAWESYLVERQREREREISKENRSKSN